MTDKNNLFKIIDDFHKCSVLVVGDIILDEYIWGKANRLSPEAPVPVLEVEKYNYIPGGAANVANNIRTLGGNVTLAGVVGVDSQAETLNSILIKNNIDTSCLINTQERPTTVKTRLLAHNRQQLVRFDREVKTPVTSQTEQTLFEKIQNSAENFDLILLSDYAKGVLTESFLKKIIDLGKSLNKPLLVDPKGLDFTKYTGVTMITPNRLEAETATKSPSGTKPEVLAEKIREQLDVQYVLVTLGEDGILICSKDKLKTIPAVTSEVYDVTGAGDSLISGISLAMIASGGDLEASVEIGNYAAGVAVRKIGTTAVTPKELKGIMEWAKV
ncbi:MAG: hypothetical protein A2Y25_03655 [Candidatus Melainabacteria bacterium GWF2_37_15]|nr:MAG: hypothetical protein A2Y25_03655 [Candidatus Melainabacteria bacterium GWF2_37_15]